MMLFAGAILFFSACNRSSVKNMDEKEILHQGSELFVQNGCAVCHSLEGKEIYGPPLDNLFMKEVKVMRNGEVHTITADRNYIRKSIVDPRNEKVLEYQNKEMPIPMFSDEEADLLVEYIILMGRKENKDK